MKKLFIIPFIITGLAAFSQSSNKELDEKIQKFSKQTDSLNSNIKYADSVYQQQMYHLDSASNSRNLDGLVSMMKEREEKQRQAAYLRIGFGVAMLALLIVGLIRKKKSKNTGNV